MDNELLVINGDDIQLSESTKTVLEEYLIAKKKFDETEKALKEQLLGLMEEHKVASITNGNVTVSYVSGTIAEGFDKKKFKEEHEELYNSYVTFTPKKAYIKISLKEEKPRKRSRRIKEE